MKRPIILSLLVAGAALAGDPGAAVVVTGSAAAADDSYRVEAVHAVGPLGAEKLLDIPNSMAILPASLIQNVQATSLKEALKYIPLAQFQEQQGSEVLRPATRGMQGSNYQNTRLDGMTVFVTGPNPIESYEQIEVFSGLPASVYGPSNPAGVFNFVSKRPTDEPLRQLNIGYDSASIYTADADLGGKIGSGAIGYRVNLLSADGTSYVDNSNLDRKLASLAFDVHPSSETRIELDGSTYRLIQKGFPGWFTYGQNATTPAKNINLPTAPDPTRVGYGQAYAGVDMKNQTGSVRVIQNLGPDWVLVVGALTQSVDRNINTPVNNLTDNAGDYTSSLANGFAPHFGISSDIAYLNGAFKTGPISHDLTVGTTGFRAVSNAVLHTPSAASVLLGKASIADPLVFAAPAAFPDVDDQYTSSVAKQQGLNFSDTIAFSRQWSLKLALSQDWMQTQNYASTGAATTSYNKNGLSPMPSLIYKPRENVTTYLTYASSLQQGDIAPGSTGVTNPNMALAPYRSTQYEGGIKANLARIDLTFALFRLERPFANLVQTAPNQTTFELSGNQINKGFEATATGRATENLNIVAGVTVLDPILQGTLDPAANDKQYVGMPKFKSNILFEYSVAQVRGLVGTLDWQYTASRPGNDTNTTWAPSYNIVDVGARYTSKVCNKVTTWRVAVNNVTDEHYWSTVGPSDLTGTDAGNMTAHLGAPRTIAASMSINF